MKKLFYIRFISNDVRIFRKWNISEYPNVVADKPNLELFIYYLFRFIRNDVRIFRKWNISEYPNIVADKPNLGPEGPLTKIFLDIPTICFGIHERSCKRVRSCAKRDDWIARPQILKWECARKAGRCLQMKVF